MASLESRLPLKPVLTPEAAREIDNFESETGRFLRGELSPERYRGFRLAHGIYGQRQPDVQMIRVKIPTGALTGDQLYRLADISQEFSTGIAHLTTRQDVQFHYVRLDRVSQVMRQLADVGLTTREACGNSVRNVTACPLSGFLAEELFNVQPYALATYAFLVRNPFCQQMARKFKIAFSACPEDCAATAIHDIGAVGRVIAPGSDPAGREETRYGFKVLVGGGLGSTPFTAQILSEFVSVGDLLPTIKAILKVFSDLGNRKNKMKARLKFVVHRLGIEEFRSRVTAALAELTEVEWQEAALPSYVPERFARLVEEHLAGSPQAGAIRSAPSLFSGRSAGEAPLPSLGGLAEDPEYLRWRSFSVRLHQDPDRAVVTVLCPLGDIEAPRLRALSRLVATYAEDHVRVARDQNLVLPSVKRSDVRALYEGLREAGLAEAGVGTALDVTACPGADTCGLGITSSKGLTRALRAELASLAGNGGLEALRGVTIKISGCPNSCGQHHIANIGLHGVVKTIAGKQIPAYQLHLGGRVGHGEARIGQTLEKLPARHVPRVVSALLRLFQAERSQGESFPDFASRISPERLRALFKPFVTELSAEERLAIDWGQEVPFTTDDIGIGECAGAGTDAAIGPFDNYQAEVFQARLFMEKRQWVDAAANLSRSLYTLARVLLERVGKSPESDYEITCEIRAQVIDRGYASDLWNEARREIDALLRTRRPDPVLVLESHERCLLLLEEARKTIAILDASKTAAPAEVPG